MKFRISFPPKWKRYSCLLLCVCVCVPFIFRVNPELSFRPVQAEGYGARIQICMQNEACLSSNAILIPLAVLPTANFAPWPDLEPLSLHELFSRNAPAAGTQQKRREREAWKVRAEITDGGNRAHALFLLAPLSRGRGSSNPTSVTISQAFP